jgi:hypothetical protein
MPDDPQVPEMQWTEHIDPERRSMDSETRYHRQYTVFDSGDGRGPAHSDRVPGTASRDDHGCISGFIAANSAGLQKL